MQDQINLSLPRGDITKCSTTCDPKRKHCLLFQLLMLCTEKADLELWLQGCSVVDLYQLQYSLPRSSPDGAQRSGANHKNPIS